MRLFKTYEKEPFNGSSYSDWHSDGDEDSQPVLITFITFKQELYDGYFFQCDRDDRNSIDLDFDENEGNNGDFVLSSDGHYSTPDSIDLDSVRMPGIYRDDSEEGTIEYTVIVNEGELFLAEVKQYLEKLNELYGKDFQLVVEDE